MIVFKRDNDDKIIAYVDYWFVDKDGNKNSLGAYCWVNEVWVHKSVRRKNFLIDFIREEHDKSPWIRWIYWTRNKYSKRMSCYDINKLYK